MAVAALGICVFSQNTKIMSAIIAAIIIGRFVLFYRRGDAMIFLLGVVLGGGNDLMSMWRGVYFYTPETVLPVPIPVWMLFFWGQGFLFFRRLMRYPWFLCEFDAPRRLLDPPLVLDLMIAAAFRMIVYKYAREPWLPDALYAAIFIPRLLLIPPLNHERRLMLTILALGPLYEIILIWSGLHVYHTGAVLGMPLWLIIYWVFISRVLKAVIDWVEWRGGPALGGGFF